MVGAWGVRGWGEWCSVYVVYQGLTNLLGKRVGCMGGESDRVLRWRTLSRTGREGESALERVSGSGWTEGMEVYKVKGEKAG